jgi:hypothetical protein
MDFASVPQLVQTKNRDFVFLKEDGVYTEFRQYKHCIFDLIAANGLTYLLQKTCKLLFK